MRRIDVLGELSDRPRDHLRVAVIGRALDRGQLLLAAATDGRAMADQLPSDFFRWRKAERGDRHAVDGDRGIHVDAILPHDKPEAFRSTVVILEPHQQVGEHRCGECRHVRHTCQQQSGQQRNSPTCQEMLPLKPHLADIITSPERLPCVLQVGVHGRWCRSPT